jgi:predicted nuclease with TOPRIM domain
MAIKELTRLKIMATTPQEVWQLLGELIEAQKETEQQLKKSKQETDFQMRKSRQEVDGQLKELEKQTREIGKQTKELGKQIGGLGKKFGSFTEGLALPSMETILREGFGMEIISPSVRASKQGQHLEIDVLAYANGDINTVYIVEVKSHAREESIDQLKTLLERFRAFFPEHDHKKLYGILAAVDLPFGVRERILKEGLYVARIHDEVFEMDTPSEFQPKHW